jgi:hypothetical protein
MPRPGALLAATLAVCSASTVSAQQPQGGQLFSTTLHGAPQEVIEPGTPGATTLQLQEWLTDIDPDVRPLVAFCVLLCFRGPRSLCRTR